jgi:ATP-dependent DNA helicase HFM1/MER3
MRLESIFIKDLTLLKESGIVKVNDTDSFLTTEYGQVMAKYYLKFQTVKKFILLKLMASEEDVFWTICQSEEFSDIRFHSDKGLLNTLNKNPSIRFPVRGKITKEYEKTSLLIQAYIAGISIEDSSGKRTHNITSEASAIYQTSNRVSRGI